MAAKKKAVKKKPALKKKVSVKKKASAKKKAPTGNRPVTKKTPKVDVIKARQDIEDDQLSLIKLSAKKAAKKPAPKKKSRRGSVGEGRPTLYRPIYCELVLELGKLGKSKIQVASTLGVTRGTIELWIEKYQEFSEAMLWARDLSQSWWEDQGQKGIWDRNFNARSFQLQIANRFPEEYSMTDKVEITGPKGGPIAVQNEWVLVPVAAKPRGKE